MLSYLIQLLFQFLPETRLFGLKRYLLRLRGYDIGENVRITSSSTFLLKYLAIGRNTWIGHETLIAGGDAWIKIGQNVDIGPRCVIINGTHRIHDGIDLKRRSGEGKSLEIVIGDGSWIGANSTILGGASIGRGSLIGAGSLILENQNIEDNCLFAGVPAKFIKRFHSQLD